MSTMIQSQKKTGLLRMRHKPERSCIVCGKKGRKQEFLRLIWQDGLQMDEKQTLPSRGAYVCCDICLDMVARKHLIRAFRLK